MAKRPEQPGDSTRAVHAGQRGAPESDAITTPIYQTATYWFRDSAELKAFQEGKLERDEYGRYGNPTWRAAERKLAELENGDEAVLFASGMCAATTAFLALLPRGGHMVVTSECYRRTRQFIDEYLVKMDIETTVIEPADPKKLADALRDDTVLFFTESPTNPYLRVIDVAEAARVCHARGAKVVLDSTFATPVNHRALDDGADLVLHSATKYLGGHNDLMAGAAVGPKEIIGELRKAVGILGGVTDANTAYLLLRTFELDADLDGTTRFIDACQIPYLAPSLGGVESLIEMPAIMSFWDRTPEERTALGMTDSLVRFSVGIEDTADLIADLDQALRA
ncbi:MAG: PLP-dependent transferase [Deltaproteobacteria bacterium]|nr:PLP-dependent transferase [Deltaproteobacteria bacterium]